MKIGKLYIKISLSFLGLFFMTLILIFVLFLLSPGKHITTRLEQYTKTRAMIVKEVMEDKIGSVPEKDLFENDQLKEFVSKIGRILGADVWLRLPDGTVPLKSFAGEIPQTSERLVKKRSRNYGDFQLNYLRHSVLYVTIPILLSEGETGGLHILFRAPEPHGPKRGFALGMIIVGLVIAILIIPLSRFIIKPLKSLNQSALKIAEGDLSHRARVKSKDEIGELCRSFNHMADKVEKMVKGGRELTANVSHELRTPLARIRIAEELLREKLQEKRDQDLIRHLDDIREDIEELDHLVGRILDLSKLDIHDSTFSFENLDPAALIKELLEWFAPVIEKKRFRLKRDLSFNPSVMGDKQALNSAILNVVSNAVKYTHTGGDVMVKTRAVTDFLEISVINSFEELNPEDLERIFDPFHRDERAKAKTGSGLGLAITKKIIERHGGYIRALNAAEGFEIRIGLPVKMDDDGK